MDIINKSEIKIVLAHLKSVESMVNCMKGTELQHKQISETINATRDFLDKWECRLENHEKKEGVEIES